MPITDHYRSGSTERLLVRVVTVDPSNNRVEVVGKDAAVIQVGVSRASALFRWPVQGEYCTIIRENGVWALEGKLQGPDGTSLQSLNPGEALIQSDTIITPMGNVVATTTEALSGYVNEVGQTGQQCAGRYLTAEDFTRMNVRVPLGIWPLNGDPNDVSGNNRHMTPKGAVVYGPGLTGPGSQAVKFTAIDAVGLYWADTGSNDPFRIRYGTFGLWFMSYRSGVIQNLFSKRRSASEYLFAMRVWNDTSGRVDVFTSSAGTDISAETQGSRQANDGHWHFLVATMDGTALRVYMDGEFDAVEYYAAESSLNSSSSAPLNIGPNGLDVSSSGLEGPTASIANVFITDEVLTQDQIRLLMAAKAPHGLARAPRAVDIRVSRDQNGGPLEPSDFPVAPVRLYTLADGSEADTGSHNAVLTPSSPLAPVVAPGPTGRLDSSRQTTAGPRYYTATDANLPAGFADRTLGLWFKTFIAASFNPMMSYGSSGLGIHFYLATGRLAVSDTVTALINPTFLTANDGLWHQVVWTYEHNGTDARNRLYYDGRFVANSTTTLGASGTVLAGAARFRLGASVDASPTSFFTGLLANAFICNYVMTPQDIIKTYNKSPGTPLLASPKNAGDHVEGMDETNLYYNFHSLNPWDQIDVEVR